MKKNNRNMIVLGGLLVAGTAILLHHQKCGIFKPLFRNQCSQLLTADTMPTRTITDEWVEQYNRSITGYKA